jgi:hypothetical protein
MTGQKAFYLQREARVPLLFTDARVPEPDGGQRGDQVAKGFAVDRRASQGVLKTGNFVAKGCVVHEKEEVLDMSEFGFPRQNKRQEIGRKGESHFASFITEKLGWVYRPVHQESDFGIDGYVDVLIDGNVTGKCFAVQIKCGDSYTSKRSAGGIKYEGKNKHLNYYLNLNTPIVFIVFTGKCDTGYWVEFDIEKTTNTTNGWWIEIEKSNEINETIRNKWINCWRTK